MDWKEAVGKLSASLVKYKHTLLIILVGILFMTVPQKKNEPALTPAIPVSQAETSITEELSQILSQIQGVGKVKVMITEMTGRETVYQTDTDRKEDGDSVSVRSEAVIVSGDGKEEGLIQTVTPPTYLGAIIVCQGGDQPAVRLAVSIAVSNVTGISMDRISVLKMK